MAIKTNENFIPFSNSVTFRKPRGTDLVTTSELVPGFCRSKSHCPDPGAASHDQKPDRGDSLRHQIPAPCPHAPPPPLAGFILKGARCSVFMLGIFLGKGVGNPREPLSICTATSTNPYHPRSIFLQKSYHCPSPQG